MITKYVEGFVPGTGKKGSVVQRITSGRDTLTIVKNPIVKYRTTQQELRGQHNTFLSSWMNLSPSEKKTWKDLIHSPEYPAVSDIVNPKTPNNLFYQTNWAAKEMGLQILRTAPTCPYIHYFPNLDIRKEFLPEKVIFEIIAEAGSKDLFASVVVGNMQTATFSSVPKEVRYIGMFELSNSRLVDITEMYNYYWGEFNYRFKYLVLIARVWHTTDIGRGYKQFFIKNVQNDLP